MAFLPDWCVYAIGAFRAWLCRWSPLDAEVVLHVTTTDDTALRDKRLRGVIRASNDRDLLICLHKPVRRRTKALTGPMIVRVRARTRATRLALLVRGGIVRPVGGMHLPEGRYRCRAFRGEPYAAVYGVDEMTVEIATTSSGEFVFGEARRRAPDTDLIDLIVAAPLSRWHHPFRLLVAKTAVQVIDTPSFFDTDARIVGTGHLSLLR